MKIDQARLHKAFHPECIAVVGRNLNWLRNLKSFPGKLYSVQVNPEQIKIIEEMGIKNYTKLGDIPEHIDLVIVATPSNVASQILEDCIAKKVNMVHFFTAGFGETHTEEGLKLEKHIIDRANETDMHVIGPNCVGVCNPKLGIKISGRQYDAKSGAVGIISQSGVQLEAFSMEAHLLGIDIGKSVSFGNGILIDSTEFLEYLGNDPDIKVIGMYIEGVRDGRHFAQVLKQVTAKKPVVIWKGGRTSAGGRATSSHSGSLAIPSTIWESVVKQCGATSVGSLEELMDTIKAMLYFPPVKGPVGLLAGSGGRAVMIADAFADAGLTVPTLTDKSYEEFKTFFRQVGGSYRNPVDIGSNQQEHIRIMKILEKDPTVDNLVMLKYVGWEQNKEQNARELRELVEIKDSTTKPLMIILAYISNPEIFARMTEVANGFHEAGIATFPTADRGARALKHAYDYYRAREAAKAG